MNSNFLRSMLFAAVFGSAAAACAEPGGHWIWSKSPAADNERGYYRKEFTLDAAPFRTLKSATLHVTCDNHAIVHLNGKQVARNDEWGSPTTARVKPQLRAGRNLIAVEAWNDSGPAGLLVTLRIELGGKPVVLTTDKTWQCMSEPRAGWHTLEFSGKGFKPAVEVAAAGGGPWGGTLNAAALGTVGAIHSANAEASGPVLLDDQFVLPEGFHIYRVAGRELSGGSYAMALDGKGRLLVGDGKSIRRLTDSNRDQVYDRAETIAGGLGGRGPQGILVRGDWLYAVGGDGLQRYSGASGDDALKHEGRLGLPFPTGGDHSAHQLVRGLDDWIYFITGDGSGNSPKHVTMKGSPTVDVRGASVYRIDPAGTQWECVGSGGRNAPGLGMNYQGEFFTFDSDLEYTHRVPNYVPTRLIHWAAGIQDGWAWNEPAGWRHHFPDLQPPVIAIGRGTPTMGVFYEHRQLPLRYRDAYLSCDYLWKQGGGHHPRTTGRVVAFHLDPNGAGYRAEMSVLVDGRAGARDAKGQRINFAAVDVIVAADGSLLISDHNQGVWRVFYDEREKPEIPRLVPDPPKPARGADRLAQVLNLPQPGSEPVRLLQDELLAGLPDAAIRDAALDAKRPLRERLRAVRIVAPGFDALPAGWIRSLAADREPELRGQAAWLYGIRRDAAAVPVVVSMLGDADAFVRRRACEAISRISADPQAVVSAAGPLLRLLSDPDARVRYAAMIALAHVPRNTWVETGLAAPDAQTRIRTVLAARWITQGYRNEWATGLVNALMEKELDRENRLALYRVVSLHAGSFAGNEQLAEHIFADFPSPDEDIRWEQVRLAGQMQTKGIRARMVAHLPKETHPVLRLVLLDTISRLPNGEDAGSEVALSRWLIAAQGGDLDERASKGIGFPGYVEAFTRRIADRSPDRYAAAIRQVNPDSFLAGPAYRAAAATGPKGVDQLMKLFAGTSEKQIRIRIVEALQNGKLSPDQVAALVAALPASNDQRLHQSSTDLVLKQAAPLPGRQALVDTLVRMTLQPDPRASTGNRILAHLAGKGPKGMEKKRSLSSAEQAVAAAYWLDWYRETHGRPFAAQLPAQKPGLSDEKIHALLLNDSKKGDARRGQALYLSRGCFACHGGAGQAAPSTTFGPTLTGITQRLNPGELADAMVYPSKKVDDRFRATAVKTRDGTSLSGFLTRKSDAEITLVTPQGQLHVIPRSNIEEMGQDKTSPMPAGLLRHLDAGEIGDLMAWLRNH